MWIFSFNLAKPRLWICHFLFFIIHRLSRIVKLIFVGAITNRPFIFHTMRAHSMRPYTPAQLIAKATSFSSPLVLVCVKKNTDAIKTSVFFWCGWEDPCGPSRVGRTIHWTVLSLRDGWLPPSSSLGNLLFKSSLLDNKKRLAKLIFIWCGWEDLSPHVEDTRS